MDLEMGTHKFINVSIPLLWGTRAVVQDRKGRLSIIDVGRGTGRLEVLGDKPAPDVEYRPLEQGFEVRRDGEPQYSYDPTDKRLSAIATNLPDCTVSGEAISVGGSTFVGNTVVGFGVGIAVSGSGISMGAPLPPWLAARATKE